MHKKQKIALIAVVFLLALGFSLFLLRGWIRSTIIPAYVDKFYKSSIQQAFQSDLAGPNEKLKEFNLTAPEQLDSYAVKCFDPNFRGIEYQIRCHIPSFDSGSVAGSSVKPDDAYVARWKQKSKGLENYLLANGWLKTTTVPGRQIDEILDYSENGLDIYVSYLKQHGKIDCSIYIGFSHVYNSQTGLNHPVSNGNLKSNMSCSRYINFFGGY